MAKKVIWKYMIKPREEQKLQMPEGAEILCSQDQKGNPWIWALVDPEGKLETRTFRLYWTGREIEEDTDKIRYIGTWQDEEFGLVWHLFEEVKDGLF